LSKVSQLSFSSCLFILRNKELYQISSVQKLESSLFGNWVNNENVYLF